MDMKHEFQEYQQIHGWLKGEKPPAQGRTWRRGVHNVAVKVVPPWVRKTTGDGLGLVVVGAGGSLGVLGAVVLSWGLFAMSGVMLDLVTRAAPLAQGPSALPIEGILEGLKPVMQLMVSLALPVLLVWHGIQFFWHRE